VHEKSNEAMLYGMKERMNIQEHSTHNVVFSNGGVFHLLNAKNKQSTGNIFIILANAPNVFKMHFAGINISLLLIGSSVSKL
jgi:hypothetical protein